MRLNSLSAKRSSKFKFSRMVVDRSYAVNIQRDVRQPIFITQRGIAYNISALTTYRHVNVLYLILTKANFRNAKTYFTMTSNIFVTFYRTSA